MPKSPVEKTSEKKVSPNNSQAIEQRILLKEKEAAETPLGLNNRTRAKMEGLKPIKILIK